MPVNTLSRSLSFHKGYASLRYTTARLRGLFTALDSDSDFAIPQGELSVAFLDDAALAHIHHRFLNDPSATDVITFPGDPCMGFAGEICVSVERARRVRLRWGNPFSRELTLYLVHGWLHLAGCKDHTLAERRRMRAAETLVLSRLEAAKALPDFTIVV